MNRVRYTQHTTLEKTIARLYQRLLDVEQENGNPECDVWIDGNEVQIQCDLDVDDEQYGYRLIEFGDYSGSWNSKGYGSSD